MKKGAHMLAICLLISLCLGLAGCGSNGPASAESTPPAAVTPTPTSTAELSPVEGTLAGMTLEEKVGQMFLVRCPERDGAELAGEYALGGYLLFGRDFANGTPQSVRADIDAYQAAARVPMLIAVDEEGGTVTRVSRFTPFRSIHFPAPRQVYESGYGIGGMDAVRQDAEEKADLLLSLGINVNLAPVCDLSDDPNDFIYDRAFSGDPELTGEYAAAVVSVSREKGLGSVLKHFPGYGNNADTHTGIAYDHRDMETFEQADFVPFRAGIEAGAGGVLVSHNIVFAMDDTLPASLSPEVHRVLREELGFEGVIITDDLAMDAIGQFTDGKEAAVLAVEAGNDLLCCSDYQTQIPAVLQAVREGRISEERIDESVRRILTWKAELGLLA